MATDPASLRQAGLRRLLNPRHIAFVGGRALVSAIRNCEGLGYTGEMWVVNPAYDELAGLPCYPAVAELPAAPDAAFVGVRRDLTIEVVEELAARGAGGCVCYAAGFAELGVAGRSLQEQLITAADQMALVGPNCYGILNYLDGVALWPDLHGGARVPAGVAIVAQSGNISLNATMADRSLPLSHVISIGNQAGLGLGDYVDALVDDPRVRAIGLYVEGIPDIERFSSAALRALHRGVPLVALNVGASPLAAQIARGHTGSLAQAERRSQFERLAIPLVGSVSELLETLKLLAGWGGTGGRRLGVLAASGGDAAVFADLAVAAGFDFPPFDAARATELQGRLGDLVTVGNPLDYNMAVWGKRAELERCFVTVMEGAFDAVLLTIDYPRAGTGDTDPWDVAVDAFSAARERTGGRAAVLSTLPEGLPGAARERLLARGIVPLQGLREALCALDATAWYSDRRRALGAAGAVRDSA